MKTSRIILQVLFLVSGVLSFVSCDDNDEKLITPSNQLLVGTWSYETAEIDLTVNGQSIVDYLIEVFELPEEQAVQIASMVEVASFQFNNATWKFNQDNTFTVVDEDETTNGTWSLSEDKKKLSLTADGETNTVDVIVLSSSKLQIFMTIEEEDDVDEDGTNEVLLIDATLTLKK
jgi:hypothetical protein